MVDTPGTESLNARHNQVSENAIENICDAIVVIIPYDKPVSEDLLNYVKLHLNKQKQECIFVVTKVELLEDREELPQLMRVIKKRLENGLDIGSACVIPMPTLIYLKETDPEMQTTFLDNIPEEEKKELIQLYEEGLEKINERLNTNRINYIQKKIINICERVISKLNVNLTDVVLDYEEKNKQLQREAVEPISTFESAAKDHETGSLKKIAIDFNSFIKKCESKRINKGAIKSVEEREKELIARGRGNIITDALRDMWRVEINKYGALSQEEVIL